MRVRQNFSFMARPWMSWGVLSLYRDFVTCFCEVSLCSCESKKTIRLTDPTRCLPCPLLHFAALYCSLFTFAAFYLPCTAPDNPLLPLTCPLLPCCLLLLSTAFYCPLPALYWPLPLFTALYCPVPPCTALYLPHTAHTPSEWAVGHETN